MNRKLLVTLIAVIVVAIVTGTSIFYAWYTNANKSESVDYVSDGLVISYRIDNSTPNIEQYNIENVVFFDVDSTREGKYFSVSAVKLTLLIDNYSSTSVDVTLKQDIQPFTLSNSIEDNEMTIYQYTEANVNRSTTFTANTYFTFDNLTGYTAQTRYESGKVYYTREAFITATLTAEDGSLTGVEAVDANSNDLITSFDSEENQFIVGQYIEAANLTKYAFNAGVYYTKSGSVYTQAKVYNQSTTYYEVHTMAYVGGLTIDDTEVTAAAVTTTGAYITCAITEDDLDTSGDEGESVNSLFELYELSNEYVIPYSLDPSEEYNTAGGSAEVYLYIFGIQLFDPATSNFLENSRNVYPFKLIITAVQAS